MAANSPESHTCPAANLASLELLVQFTEAILVVCRDFFPELGFWDAGEELAQCFVAGGHLDRWSKEVLPLPE